MVDVVDEDDDDDDDDDHPHDMSRFARKPVSRISDQNFGFMKKSDCTIYVGKTKALISCRVSVQLICIFVFGYA